MLSGVYVGLMFYRSGLLPSAVLDHIYVSMGWISSPTAKLFALALA